MSKFAVGEVAIYWDPPSGPNHNKDVLIIGPYTTGVMVLDSWTGTVSKLDGHEISRDGGIEFGPLASPRARCFARIDHLRKKKPPGAVKMRDVTEAQARSRSSGTTIYELSTEEQTEEA